MFGPGYSATRLKSPMEQKQQVSEREPDYVHSKNKPEEHAQATGATDAQDHVTPQDTRASDQKHTV